MGLIGFPAAILFAAFVFKPILTSKHPAASQDRFQLVDLFALVLLCQYPLLVVITIHRLDFARQTILPFEWALLGIFEVVMIAVWKGQIAHLSQRGVHSAVRRFAVMAIAVPAGVAATLSLLVTIIVLVSGKPQSYPLVVTILVALLTVGVGCRAIFTWALTAGVGDSSRESGDDASSPFSTSDRSD